MLKQTLGRLLSRNPFPFLDHKERPSGARRAPATACEKMSPLSSLARPRSFRLPPSLCLPRRIALAHPLIPDVSGPKSAVLHGIVNFLRLYIVTGQTCLKVVFESRNLKFIIVALIKSFPAALSLCSFSRGRGAQP